MCYTMVEYSTRRIASVGPRVNLIIFTSVQHCVQIFECVLVGEQIVHLRLAMENEFPHSNSANDYMHKLCIALKIQILSVLIWYSEYI
jgi:hypothetical protein